jgi:hypothetical protein
MLSGDAEVAKQLLGDAESNAVAMGLYKAGAKGAAVEAASGGLRNFMEN